jgi:Ca2+-transporting ATPase
VLEALGGISTLCLDKTGTLTANAMTVRVIRTAARELAVTGDGFAPTGDFVDAGQRIDPAADPLLLALLHAGRSCNEAALEQNAEDRSWKALGDPSEAALLGAAGKAGLGIGPLVQEVLRTIPAAAGHPWMVVLARQAGVVRAYVKGAPEQLFERCTTVRTAAGPQPIDEAKKKEWREANAQLAERALRVFALAVSPDGAEPDPEQGFELLGLVGMADPPRAGVKEALAAAHQAGIRTIMITGDQPATALAIARELDLAAGREPRVRSGADAPAADEDVYARATPEGKLLLVRALQQSGQTVAMTGDGVNDGPALRAADAGIAMGRGTEVAKAAAAIVLLDERLDTVLVAIREGRSVFVNIQRALDYLLSCSTATVLTVLLATVVEFPPVLLPLQILYLNLLMHTFPALGLTLEPADPEVMRQPPLPRASALLPPARLAAVLWHGLVIAALTLAVSSWAIHHGGIEHGRSLTFAVLATALLLHAFSDSSPRAFAGWLLWRKPTLVIFVGLALALQALALYLPPLRRLLSMTALDWHDWLGILGAAVASVLVIEVSKRTFRSS